MSSSPVLFLVGTECQPEQEEKFNKWYNETHIPMLLKSRFLDGVSRYQLSPIVAPAMYPAPKYAAIYEFKDAGAYEAWYKSTELMAARTEMQGTWGDKMFKVHMRALYEPIQSWRR